MYTLCISKPFCLQVTHSSHPSLAESVPPRHSNTWGKFRKPNETSRKVTASPITILSSHETLLNLEGCETSSKHTILTFAICILYLHKQKDIKELHIFSEILHVSWIAKKIAQLLATPCLVCQGIFAIF